MPKGICNRNINDSSCLGCDGVPNSGKKDYGCGCGSGTSCFGCDGRPYSGKTVVCGTCGGSYTVCGDCSSTCCRAAIGSYAGARCISFSGYNDMRFSGGIWWIQGFYSWEGGWYSNNWVDKQSGWCQANGVICGSMRCYESEKDTRDGVNLYNTSVAEGVWQIAYSHCPISNHGCFDPATTLLLEGGRVIQASDVQLGDRLYNSLSGRSFPVKRILAGEEPLPMVELGYQGYLLRVTQQHPIITNAGVKRAKNIAVGDIILDADGNERRVEYVRFAEVVPGQRVINFELDVDSHDPLDRVIVGENIASADLAVQQSTLPGE